MIIIKKNLYKQSKKESKTRSPVSSLKEFLDLTCIMLKSATLLKVPLLHGCFLRFPNFTNGTKSRQASQYNP